MDKYKRKRFFVKGNFQIAFIVGFLVLLCVEVLVAAALIYGASYGAIEGAAFSSHITMSRSAELIGPIILKINGYVVIASIILSCGVVAIAYARLCALFARIIEGIEQLKRKRFSFRIHERGGKNSRQLIKEFNQAADCIEKRQAVLRGVLDSLLSEKELTYIAKLHAQLYAMFADKN